MDIALQYLINGLMLGVMYALVAVGFTLFFGVLDVIKFSHGDVLTVGVFTGFAAYLALKAAQITSPLVQLVVISLVAMAAMAVLGAVIAAHPGAAAALGARAQYPADHAHARHRAARRRAPAVSRRLQSQAVPGACSQPTPSAGAISRCGSTACSCWPRVWP